MHTYIHNIHIYTYTAASCTDSYIAMSVCMLRMMWYRTSCLILEFGKNVINYFAQHVSCLCQMYLVLNLSTCLPHLISVPESAFQVCQVIL